MEPEEFKQKGFKKGDRVELHYIARWSEGTMTGVFVKYDDQYVCVEDINGQHWYHFEYIKDIKKLKVTKKKEKKEGMTKKQYNELVDIAGRAIPILHQKPIKSLSTLEIGDEVQDREGNFRKCLGRNGDLVALSYASNVQPNWASIYSTHKTIQEMKEDGYSIPNTKDTSIIDEMIKYFEGSLFHLNAWAEKDNSWTPQIKKINKFITYLKDLKNQ